MLVILYKIHISVFKSSKIHFHFCFKEIKDRVKIIFVLSKKTVQIVSTEHNLNLEYSFTKYICTTF